MSASPSTGTEAQSPTPGQAERSTSPSEEKAMNESNGSPAASTASTLPSSQEDAMSTDSSTSPSSSPSSGASTGSTQVTNPEDAKSTGSSSPSSGASTGSTSTSQPTSPGSGDTRAKDAKRKYAGKYLRGEPFSRAEAVMKEAKPVDDAGVAADLALTSNCFQRAGDARTRALKCEEAAQTARARRDEAILKLKPALIGALWLLRVQQPGGRKFAAGLVGETDVQTAENVLLQVPGSEHPLPAEALKNLRDAVPAVRDGEDAVAKAEKAEAEAAAGYDEGLTALSAATSILTGALNRMRFAARIPEEAKPAAAPAKSKKKDS